MAMIDERQIQEWFTYHSPRGNQNERYEKIRSKAKELAMIIFNNCPESADRTHALRVLRDAMMWANASIALE